MHWFTSDTHFGHEKAIKYNNRPFSTVEEMDEALIENWNSRVKRGDVVYHLGDFSQYKHDPARRTNDVLRRLNGTKILVVGNHDRDLTKHNKWWARVEKYHEVTVKVNSTQTQKQSIILCHYPIRSWRAMHRDSWHLHGHSHGNLEDIGGKILDVGVDCHDYCPINLDTVIAYMKSRKPVCVDHHRKKED